MGYPPLHLSFYLLNYDSTEMSLIGLRYRIGHQSDFLVCLYIYDPSHPIRVTVVLLAIFHDSFLRYCDLG